MAESPSDPKNTPECGSPEQDEETKQANVKLLETLLHLAKTTGVNIHTSVSEFENLETGEDVYVCIAQIITLGSPQTLGGVVN